MQFGGVKMKIRTLEISELNQYINRVLNDDPILSNVKVKGEISNLKMHSSGNIYLTLKDDKSKINCMIYKKNVNNKLKLEDGNKVIATGYVSSYLRDGVYQLYIESIEIEGMGTLFYEFLKLKERLDKEGLFSVAHKKQIPRFPKNIGVITSPTGAVIRDIINVVSRRYPKVNIKLYPVQVQGVNSAKTLVEGIRFLNNVGDIDTIIIGRGGGSLEELWSFNEEIVARAIYNSSIPVISAVGHETDFTICDFVADMRAPTPSAAAEIATPNLFDLEYTQKNRMMRMSKSIKNIISVEKEKIKLSKNKYNVQLEKVVINDRYIDLDRINLSLENSMERLFVTKKNSLNMLASSFGSLNPFSVLERGYSIVENKNGLVSSREKLEIGDELDVVFSDGKVKCEVIEK